MCTRAQLLNFRTCLIGHHNFFILITIWQACCSFLYPDNRLTFFSDWMFWGVFFLLFFFGGEGGGAKNRLSILSVAKNHIHHPGPHLRQQLSENVNIKICTEL